MKRNKHFLSFRLSFAIILLLIVFSNTSNADMYTPDAELLNSWGVERIGAGLAHESGITGSGIKIGIIDSGIDYTHPELSANYSGGWDYVNNDNDPIDDYGHGTYLAGIIGAADDGQGVVGVAPDASLYAYKVFNSNGVGSYDYIIAAIKRAIVDGINVINMSFGSLGDPGQNFFDACEEASAAGILLIAAAGNSGSPNGEGDNIFYPARYPSVIAVGATTEMDERTSTSATGPNLELMAPGQGITTTDLYLNGTNTNMYVTESGTSLAAAHVTGAAALYLSSGIMDVRSMLQFTALDLWTPGFDTLTGYGLVNVEVAVVPVPSSVVIALFGFGTFFMFRKSKSLAYNN